ncbi:unnamed protein product [Ectocarpus sp. 12 AP-2014]
MILCPPDPCSWPMIAAEHRTTPPLSNQSFESPWPLFLRFPTPLAIIYMYIQDLVTFHASAFLSLVAASLFSRFLLRGTQEACRYINACARSSVGLHGACG